MSGNSVSNIRELRLKKGWSQEQLAAVTSLSKRTIQRIESGTPASLETANALVCAFGLSGLHELHECHERTSPAPYPLKKREPIYFENKPMNSFSFLLTFLGSAMFAIMLFLLLKQLSLSGLMKKDGAQGFIVAVTSFMVSIFYIINTYNEYRVGNEKHPESKEERLPSLLPAKVKDDGSQMSFLRFIRNHPVRKGEFPVGINESTGNMVFTKSSTGALMIGEEGSAIWIAALGQLYPMLCEQRTGLVILPRENANYVLHIKSVLSTIERKDDIVVLSELDVQALDKEQIKQHASNRKILIFVSSGPRCTISSNLLNTWLESMSEPQPPHAYTPPFLLVSDENLGDAIFLRKSLKKARSASSLWAMLIVTEPAQVLSEQDAFLMSYFGNRYLLRLHSWQIAEQLLKRLWPGNDAPISSSHLIKLKAGVSVYCRDGLCWDNIRLTFLGEDMYKC